MDTQLEGDPSGGVQANPEDDRAAFNMNQRPLALPLLILGGVIIWCIVLWLLL